MSLPGGGGTEAETEYLMTQPITTTQFLLESYKDSPSPSHTSSLNHPDQISKAYPYIYGKILPSIDYVELLTPKIYGLTDVKADPLSFE